MSRPDEGLIHQWLDGECTPEESARIERLVATDAEWAAAVAEARGLIAASSRIVGALDAVPRAMPVGSKAAPATTQDLAPPRRAARRRFVVAPWIGVAAGLLLVAGTAYVLREQSGEPFGIVTTQTAAPFVMDTAPGVQIGRAGDRPQPPSDVPATGVAGSATASDAITPPRSAAASGAGASGIVAEVAPASAPMAAPTPAPAPPPAVQRAEEDAAWRRSAELAAEQERARAARTTAVTRDASRTPARQAAAQVAPAPMAAPTTTLSVLDGCWRVSAPPSLIGVLIAPPIRRAAGDTLVLLTLVGDVTVVRDGDVLRGGLEAKQEPCRTP